MGKGIAQNVSSMSWSHLFCHLGEASQIAPQALKNLTICQTKPFLEARTELKLSGFNISVSVIIPVSSWLSFT